MALVGVFQISGLTLWFPSNDHEPPHFHAKRAGEWEVKVHFLEDKPRMIKVKWGNTKGWSKILNEITTLAEEHRVELLAEWEAVHPKD